MTATEKQLYHQVHPIKLLADWGSTPFSLYLFWHHYLAGALVVAFVPSLISSALLIRFAALERCRDSRFGHYVKRHMSAPMQAVRLLGFAMMAVGAWFNLWWSIPLGLAVVLFGWLRGLILPRLDSILDWRAQR